LPYSASAATQPNTAPAAVDFLQGDAPLRLELDGQWNAGAPATVHIPRPAFRQERAQSDTDRHLAAGQGERDLTVGLFAKLPAILVRHADRLAPLFDQGRVVDRQDGVSTADEILGLADQFKLPGLRPPG
jgi:hypothetical protein